MKEGSSQDNSAAASNGAKSGLASSIRLLPQEVIHRIAAGEVVDRPLSVLKELLENAIDSGASRIKVVLLDGGAQLVEVEDNGCGMSRADLSVAVQRHATSKVRSMEDLDEIHSLGFRGEALSAIASVTRLEIESAKKIGDPTSVNGSHSESQIESWLLEVVGGVKRPLKPASRIKGTKVRAQDLFFNIPARRKFLKKSSSESSDCVALLETFALIHPHISFEWHVMDAGGELKAHHQLAPTSLEERYQTLCPKEGELFKVEKENPYPGVLKIEIVGLKPPASSAFQKSTVLSVNDRWVVDKRLPFSMREAFQGLISMGAYPYVYVRVHVEPSLIDVNIHPQKREIRWPSGFSLAGIAYSLVRPLFEAKSTGPSISATQHEFSLGAAAVDDSSDARQIRASQEDLTYSQAHKIFSASSFSGAPQVNDPPNDRANHQSKSAAAYDAAVPSFSEAAPQNIKLGAIPSGIEARPDFKFSSLRVVGEVGAAWIVCEHPQGMIVIDQHAAHERVNFEKILCASHQEGAALLRSKPLLLPMVLKLPLGVDAEDSRLKEVLEGLGFEIGDPLGPSDQVELIAVPDTDRKIDWSKMLEQIFEDIKNDDDPRSIIETLKVKLAASLSCHGSVRRGQRLAHEQIQALLKQMDEVSWGGLCPHGRPLWFLLSHQSLEQSFHR